MSSNQKNVIQIHADDGVAVALAPLSKGTTVTVTGGNAPLEVTLLNDIPQGHKFALKDIAEGEPVIKYGYPIGAAKAAIKKAREVIAKCINAKPEEIYFTSGGTEANNMAIIGTALAKRKTGNKIKQSIISRKRIVAKEFYYEKKAKIDTSCFMCLVCGIDEFIGVVTAYGIVESDLLVVFTIVGSDIYVGKYIVFAALLCDCLLVQSTGKDVFNNSARLFCECKIIDSIVAS